MLEKESNNHNYNIITRLIIMLIIGAMIAQIRKIITMIIAKIIIIIMG